MFKKIELEELVFAVPRNKLWELLPYRETGFIDGSKEVLDSIIKNGIFRKRNLLEEDPSFKQIIPYAIISSKESLLLFTRKPGQREKRLHNKLHLGLGGHMNPPKSNKINYQFPVSELRRELFEELNLLNACKIESIEFLGFINDDAVPVGHVHLGLLFNVDLSDKNVSVNEINKMAAEWIDKKSLANYYDEIETWSKIAIDYYLR